MDFELTDEQRLLRDTVREFARQEVAPVAEELDRDEALPLRDRREDGRARADGRSRSRGVRRAAAPTRSPTRSRSRSWRGSTPRSASRWPRTPRSARCRSTSGAPTSRRPSGCPSSARGRKLAAFGLTEPEAGSDAGNTRTRAEPRGRRVGDRRRQAVHHQLRHRHLRLRDDHRASPATGRRARSRTSSSPTARRATSPASRTGRWAGTRPTPARSPSTDCRVPEANLLGRRGEGFKQFLHILDGGRIGVAAMGVGLAQGALDEAIAYAKERRAFGQPISKFQAIQIEDRRPLRRRSRRRACSPTRRRSRRTAASRSRSPPRRRS